MEFINNEETDIKVKLLFDEFVE